MPQPSQSQVDPYLQKLKSAVLRICKQHSDGLTDKELREKLEQDVKSTIPADSYDKLRAEAYNKLLRLGRVRLAYRMNDGKREIIYIWVSAQNAEKFRGLDTTETMVYDIVRRSGQNGVTKRDVKIKTNLGTSTEVKQIMERLITRRLVKEIRSVQATNKRVYIIWELEASAVHTGGPWYNDDQEFDEVFINAIYMQVSKYIKTNSIVTVDQVTQYVAALKVSNETLTQEDIETLMRTMVYDGEVEECEGNADGDKYFRVVKPVPSGNQLARIPCGKCPVFDDCTPGGVISPQTCVYMAEWLKEVELDW